MIESHLPPDESQSRWASVRHREEEYDSAGFEILQCMQSDHFWYRGRHRFLYHAFVKCIQGNLTDRSHLRIVDLGGGCGGWIRYLRDRWDGPSATYGLADSSSRALEIAAPIVGSDTGRYQVDLLDLGWNERWDIAFLLDVLEHMPEDVEVLNQVGKALKPGGLLFVTCPALRFFWSYNDVVARHCRRYSSADLRCKAEAAGYELVRLRYFHFFLSPLLWIQRTWGLDPATMTPEQLRSVLERTHQVPPYLVNAFLGLIFGAEIPLGWSLPFPWGTSILGVFRRPR